MLTPKFPQDANGNEIPVLKPSGGTNKATTETFVNTTDADGSDVEVYRLVATDADATIYITADGTHADDGAFLPQALPEYFHIPVGWSVYVENATVNFSPCV